MIFTPEEQADYDYLKSKYVTPFDVPPPEPERPGLIARTAKGIGNVPSMALEGLMGVGTAGINLFLGDERQAPAQIPRIFDVPAPQTAGETLADVPGQLAAMAPQFLVPGGIAGKIATEVGLGGRAANVIAQTVGGAVGGAPFGPTSSGVNAASGVVQGLAEMLPRPARGLLALGTGAIGAGGVLAEGGTPTQAISAGIINAAGTFASPQIKKALNPIPVVGQVAPEGALTRIPASQTIGGPPLGPEPAPVGSVGPVPAPVTVAGGAVPVPAAAAAPVPSNVIPFAPLQTGVPAVAEGGGGLMFGAGSILPEGMTSPRRMRRGFVPGEAPMPVAPELAPLQITTPAPRGPLEVPSGSLMRRPEAPEGALMDIGQEPQMIQPSGGLMDIGARPTGRHELIREVPPDRSAYGRGTDPFDTFASLQNRRVTETQPVGVEAPPAPPTAPAEPVQVPKNHPQNKLASGLLKKLTLAPGWKEAGEPLSQGFTNDAFEFGRTFKTDADVKRAYAGAKKFEKAGLAMLEDGNVDGAQELLTKAQYLKEAAEFAEGVPGKVDLYRQHVDPNYTPPVPGKAYKEKYTVTPEAGAAKPDIHDIVPAIKINGKLVKGQKGDIHQDILNRHLAENPDDADAIMNFNSKENPNLFVAGEKEISRAQLKEMHGVEDSQGLRDRQAANPQKPVKPAADEAPVASLQKVRIKGRFGMEEATVLSREGDVLNIEVDDPIFGPRKATVLASEAHPIVEAVPIPESAKGRPFADVPGAKTQLEKADEPYGGEGGLLGASTDKNPPYRSIWINKSGEVIGSTESEFHSPLGARHLQSKRIRFDESEVYRKMHERGWTRGVVDDNVLYVDNKNLTQSMRRRLEEIALDRELLVVAGGKDLFDFREAPEGEVLGTLLPGTIKKTIPGKKKTNLTLLEGFKRLPAEAATLVESIFNRMQMALGHEVTTDFALHMPGMKGGAYEKSGRVVLNLQWINGVVKNWEKMSERSKNKALTQIASLFGHEVTHVVQKYGEASGLAINGKPLLRAVVEQVHALTLEQRMYIARQIKEAKGETSHYVSRYLAGDPDAIRLSYERFRGKLSKEEIEELAAGEFMAELGAQELVRRAKFDGLPTGLREMLDKFKAVIIRTIDWFKGQNNTEAIAALQNLKDMSAKMYDHFSTADVASLQKAFPASEKWKVPTPLVPKPTIPTIPIPSVASQPFVRNELIRLGVRAGAGALVGGIAGPTVSDHSMSTAESMMLGGVMGLFGPAFAKTLITGTLAKEIQAARAAGKGNTMATFRALVGGKTLTELGREGRYGWRGDGSTMAKVVRTLEQHFSLGFDPKLKAAIEQGRGIAAEQFALIEDALKKSRWVKPSQWALDKSAEYIEGKIGKVDYLASLQDDASQRFGQFMVAAREGTSVLSEMFASGLPKSKFQREVIKALSSYVKRHYDAYRSGKFNMDYFDAVKKDLMSANPGMDIHNADAILREHMLEIQANRRLFKGARGTGTQAIDPTLKFRRLATEEEIEAQQIKVAELEHDPYSDAYKAEKAKLDWMETHKITDNWRGWLGEIKDPTERMIYTFQKLYPSAIAGKIYDLLDNSTNSLGNKFAYTAHELTSARALLESEIKKHGAGAPELASLQERLAELATYSPLPEGAAYGRLAGKYTDRFVRDHISTYDTPYKWMEQPIIRGIASINSVVKVNRTVLNPLTMVRNYLQMPLFMLIARAGIKDLSDAAKVLHKGADPELLSLMRRRHILGVDYATEELTANLGHMVSGYFDSDMAVRIAKYGYNRAIQAYQQPDLLVRAAAFMSARRRLAQRMNLPISDIRVTDAAVEQADRLTMNYATVPKVVKAARQLPFVSLFVSYTSEITKIIKNLIQDATNSSAHQSDRMHAMGVLGAMAAIPPMLALGFESNLSEKDRKDWQQVRKLQPGYARSRFMLPLYRDKQGRFHYMDMTNMIPADNYTQMISGALSGDMEAVQAANPWVALQDTPLLNIATEQISGESLRTHEKISGAGRIREILQEVLPPIVPPGYEGQRMARAFTPSESGSLGVTNLRTGVITTPGDIIANYLTGMRFGNVNLASLQKQAVAQARENIAEEQTHLRSVTNLNVADEKKVEAQMRYRQNVEQIILQLQSKMGKPKT